MLTLEGDTTYASLQSRLELELGVPPASQRIKYGFPPRELKAPNEGNEEEDLPLQHGDRVTVEVLPEVKKGTFSFLH